MTGGQWGAGWHLGIAHASGCRTVIRSDLRSIELRATKGDRGSYRRLLHGSQGVDGRDEI